MNSGELLERSLAYTLGRVTSVRPGSLERATPCAQWDLGALLDHLNDSLDALYEGLTGGRIGLVPTGIPIPPAASAGGRVRCSVPGPRVPWTPS